MTIQKLAERRWQNFNVPLQGGPGVSVQPLQIGTEQKQSGLALTKEKGLHPFAHAERKKATSEARTQRGRQTESLVPSTGLSLAAAPFQRLHQLWMNTRHFDSSSVPARTQRGGSRVLSGRCPYVTWPFTMACSIKYSWRRRRRISPARKAPLGSVRDSRPSTNDK